MHIDVVLHAEQLGKQQTARQSERHRQHHRHRDEEAFIEGDHHEIGKDDANEEDEDDTVRRLALLAGNAAKLEAVAHGQLLCGSLLNGTNGSTRTAALRHATRHIDAAEHIETVERLRHILLGEGNELVDRHHFAALGTNKEIR